MQRKEFFEKSATSFLIVNSLSLFDVFASPLNKSANMAGRNLCAVDDDLRQAFKTLVEFLKANKWDTFLVQQIHKRDIQWDDDQHLCEVLSDIDRTKENGFDDFAGDKLIEPGNPSLSLLYHALASPRVKDRGIIAYPTIEHLDILENFIYSLKKWEDYIDGVNEDNLRLMVLAYEYRPAFKTPVFDPKHDLSAKKCAQIVFSRTGVARIGNEESNYDLENRCFTNLPKNPNNKKQIAVTPARYGLFLTELVSVNEDKSDQIKLMNYQADESTHLGRRHFVRPLRKIFNDSSCKLEFAEYHLNEKLYQLTQFKLDEQRFEFAPQADINAIPFRRISCTNDAGKEFTYHATDVKMVSLTREGSTVLLSSFPNSLVRKALQNGKFLSFKVPTKWNENHLSNRRYNAFKVTGKKNKDVNDAVWTDFIYRRNRRTTRFRAPKNAPLFVNIKFEIDPNGNNDGISIPNDSMEEFINKGNYNAQLFEDSICDGAISVRLTFAGFSDNNNIQNIMEKNGDILPAFSLVSAPDFFPFMDGNDIRAYYFYNGHTVDGSFLEGGSINLSGIRQRGNPHLISPFNGEPAFRESFTTDKSFDTLTAVISAQEENKFTTNTDFRINYFRDYQNTSFLPDTCTGIFFPGWEVTYAGDNIQNPFLSTSGLGSPFAEDMKLCAAANGMWPVASPDAGRTFQGSLEKFPLLGKPSTSIPLMDDEIGLSPNSPHVNDHAQASCFGWDGEQGPFLHRNPTLNKVFVNFTDIGRADYVANILDDKIGFDISKLRLLETRELIRRLDCLREVIKKISPPFQNKEPEYTKYWLVSAEKVSNWTIGADAFGIPNNLMGKDNLWAKQSDGLSGEGYFFVFALTHDNGIVELETSSGKRRNQEVEKLAICKIVKNDYVSEAIIKYIVLDASELDNDSKTIENKWIV